MLADLLAFMSKLPYWRGPSGKKPRVTSGLKPTKNNSLSPTALKGLNLTNNQICEFMKVLKERAHEWIDSWATETAINVCCLKLLTFGVKKKWTANTLTLGQGGTVNAYLYFWGPSSVQLPLLRYPALEIPMALVAQNSNLCVCLDILRARIEL